MYIATSGQCPICKKCAEDVSHVLFECGRAKELWRLLGLHEIIGATCTRGKSGAEVIEALLCDQINHKQYLDVVQIPDMVAVTCWYIWWQRRLIVRDEEVQNSVRTVGAIQALALNFVRAAGKPATHHR